MQKISLKDSTQNTIIMQVGQINKQIIKIAL